MNRRQKLTGFPEEAAAWVQTLRNIRVPLALLVTFGLLIWMLPGVDLDHGNLYLVQQRLFTRSVKAHLADMYLPRGPQLTDSQCREAAARNQAITLVLAAIDERNKAAGI